GCGKAQVLREVISAPRSAACFPYTTLFRSVSGGEVGVGDECGYGADAEGDAEEETACGSAGDGDGERVACGGREHCRSSVVCRADRKSTRLNSSHVKNSYAVFCLKKKKSFP